MADLATLRATLETLRAACAAEDWAQAEHCFATYEAQLQQALAARADPLHAADWRQLHQAQQALWAEFAHRRDEAAHQLAQLRQAGRAARAYLGG